MSYSACLCYINERSSVSAYKRVASNECICNTNYLYVLCCTVMHKMFRSRFGKLQNAPTFCIYACIYITACIYEIFCRFYEYWKRTPSRNLPRQKQPTYTFCAGTVIISLKKCK